MYFSHEADHKGRRLAFLQGVDLNLDKFSLSTEDHWHLSVVYLADQPPKLDGFPDLCIWWLHTSCAHNMIS